MREGLAVIVVPVLGMGIRWLRIGWLSESLAMSGRLNSRGLMQRRRHWSAERQPFRDR